MPVTKGQTRTKQLPHRDKWPGANVGNVDVNNTPIDVTLQEVAFDLSAFTGETTPQIVTFWRPTRVEAWVWHLSTLGRAELVPIGELFTTAVSKFRFTGHPSHSIGGHLVAVSLAGPDDPANLVSVSGAFNGEMGRVEQRIRNASGYPQQLVIEIPDYFDDSKPLCPWVPRTVKYTFKESDTVVTVPIQQNLLGIQMQITGSEMLTGTFAKAKLEMEQAKWTVEARVPALAQKVCLPPPALRPYAMVDYLVFEKNGQLGDTSLDATFLQYYKEHVGAPGEFAGVNYHGQFRQAMLYANAATHGSLLTSDAANDPHSYFETKGGLLVNEPYTGLVEGGGINAPEIDHIYPFDQGGCNAFSNARLTSKSYNAAKRDSVKRFEVMDSPQKDEVYTKWVAHMKQFFPDQYEKLLKEGHIK